MEHDLLPISCRAALAAGTALALPAIHFASAQAENIRVGVLHSLTGTMAISEIEPTPAPEGRPARVQPSGEWLTGEIQPSWVA